MSEDAKSTSPLLAPFDPGWLFLISGLALLSAAVLIPAQQQLTDARWRRDAALAHEQNRADRLERYQSYLTALENDDPAVVHSLTVSQLNTLPADGELPNFVTPPEYQSASVFPELEPGPVEMPVLQQRDSVLARLVTGRDSRLWVIAFAALCVLVGTLPRSRSFTE